MTWSYEFDEEGGSGDRNRPPMIPIGWVFVWIWEKVFKPIGRNYRAYKGRKNGKARTKAKRMD